MANRMKITLRKAEGVLWLTGLGTGLTILIGESVGYAYLQATGQIVFSLALALFALNRGITCLQDPPCDR